MYLTNSHYRSMRKRKYHNRQGKWGFHDEDEPEITVNTTDEYEDEDDVRFYGDENDQVRYLVGREEDR